MKLWALVKLYLPSLSHLHASLHLSSSSSTKLPFKCSYRFMALVAFSPGKQLQVAVLLWVYLFSRFQGNSLFSEFSSLMGPRKVVDFQFVQTLFLT